MHCTIILQYFLLLILESTGRGVKFSLLKIGECPETTNGSGIEGPERDFFQEKRLYIRLASEGLQRECAFRARTKTWLFPDPCPLILDF